MRSAATWMATACRRRPERRRIERPFPWGFGTRNAGSGWDPLGTSGASNAFNATFEGTSVSGPPGLRSNFVNATVGGLVGIHSPAGQGGTIVAGYATGTVSGGDRTDVGGLVGRSLASIIASYATGRVSSDARTRRGTVWVGGLVGRSQGSIVASYATGRVTRRSGLAGGLVGTDSGSTTASYWDTSTAGATWSAGGTAATTAQLQAPTGYSGLYADWNVDLNDDGTVDDPWNFGGTGQYPALKTNFDGQGTATWQEFGHQLRAGPTLTVTADGRPIALSWTAVDASAWSPAPDMTYTVTRQHGTTVTVIGAALSALTHTDAVVPVGTTYTYQVAAVVDGGEAVRSSPVSVTGVPANQPPQAVGTLPPRTLPIADGAVAVSVSDAFQDPEDDTLTYGAVSSAPSVATVGVSGSTVTVKPLTGWDHNDHGDGDRRGRVGHVGGADVRGDGAEPPAGDRGLACRPVRTGVRGRVHGGGVGCVQ